MLSTCHRGEVEKGGQYMREEMGVVQRVRIYMYVCISRIIRRSTRVIPSSDHEDPSLQNSILGRGTLFVRVRFGRLQTEDEQNIKLYARRSSFESDTAVP